jgi:DNA repair protein RadA/Sms
MAKVKTGFFCQNCGYESAKWIGRCPSCNEWNTFTEELITKEKNNPTAQNWKDQDARNVKTIALREVTSSEEKRMYAKDVELNRVLGGGIVPGSLILVAGEPGIGKSTLFLQLGLELQGIRTLYISGEESEQQIKMRADRLQKQNDEFYLSLLILFKHCNHLISKAEQVV